MTFLIARIDAASSRIGNKLCNAIDATLAGIGNKLCNAIDASLYHDWDLEDTRTTAPTCWPPMISARFDAAVESSATPGGVPSTPSAAGRSMVPTRWPSVAGTPPTHPRKPTATDRQEARSP